MNERQILSGQFNQLLARQKTDSFIPDYAILEKHKPLLHSLSELGNSGISVFDNYKLEHVFYSPNFSEQLGYKLNQIKKMGHAFLDAKIHPDDDIDLMKNGITILKFYDKFTIDEKLNYKFINEFRIKNAEENYVRVIEQHQVLELDNVGNIWLVLSIIDISPYQDIYEGVKSRLFNFRTGKMIAFDELKSKTKTELTKREKEILRLVKKGFLSKEISDKLTISVHTVNTHRQRVLEKLGVNNSMEAIILASKLGLLE